MWTDTSQAWKESLLPSRKGRPWRCSSPSWGVSGLPAESPKHLGWWRGAGCRPHVPLPTESQQFCDSRSEVFLVIKDAWLPCFHLFLSSAYVLGNLDIFGLSHLLITVLLAFQWLGFADRPAIASLHVPFLQPQLRAWPLAVPSRRLLPPPCSGWQGGARSLCWRTAICFQLLCRSLPDKLPESTWGLTSVPGPYNVAKFGWMCSC